MAASGAPRWNIVETRAVETRKSADGAKRVNNYALLRTLGHGRFAKVKLVERIPPLAPTPPAAPTVDDPEALGPPPPSMAPLRPMFAPAAPSPPVAAEAPRRQFAMKIFSKATLSKMKDYVSHAPRHSDDDEATALAASSSPPPPPPPRTYAPGTMRVVTALDRVRDEVRIMRSLYHRNVVLLFEVIEAESSDKIYLVVEYMPLGPCMAFRPDTKDFVSPLTGSVLTDELARAHTLDILKGLQYLHARGVCHRDLKPDNVLLNAEGRCHISDFGSALQQTSSTPLRVTDTVGTYQFLSPESCAGDPYDPFAADVWAVGVILFVFLFGRLPFQGDTTKELFDDILRCELVIPDEPRAVSGACRDLLSRLLCKDASQRISIADALRHPWLCPPAEEDDEDQPPSF